MIAGRTRKGVNGVFWEGIPGLRCAPYPEKPGTKKTGEMAGFFSASGSGDLRACQSLDAGAQTALLTSNLVLGEHALVNHAVHNRLGFFESRFRFFRLAGFNAGLNLLDVSARHGTQACVVDRKS